VAASPMASEVEDHAGMNPSEDRSSFSTPQLAASS
jgi:hypothetical protein